MTKLRNLVIQDPEAFEARAPKHAICHYRAEDGSDACSPVLERYPDGDVRIRDRDEMVVIPARDVIEILEI